MTTTDAEQAEARSDRRVLLVSSAALLFVYAFGAAVQTEFVFANYLPDDMPRMFGRRLVANFGGLGVNVALLWVFRVDRASQGSRAWLGALAAATIGAAVRAGLQVVLGIHESPAETSILPEFVVGFFACVIANGMALAYMKSRRRVHEQATAAAHNQMQVQLALQALAHEEIRVRREVAEGLHGSLQQRLVLIAKRVQEVVDNLERREASESDIASLRQAVAEMEVVREGDVREMSRLLYPDAIEIGMVPAVRSLLGRLPTSIGTRLVVSDAVRRLDDPAAPALSQTERLLAVRVVEEAATNALRHGGASRIDVVVREESGRLQVVVTDNGAGYDSGAEDVTQRSGLARLADRLAIIGGTLDISSLPGAGATVTAWLPLAQSE